MSKHTPGPWFVKKEWSDDPISEQREIFTVESSDGTLGINLDGTYWGRCAIDAQLIAAAPDLLVALENMLVYAALPIDSSVRAKAFDEAYAAIARAKG